MTKILIFFKGDPNVVTPVKKDTGKLTHPSWNCAWADSSATRVSYSSAANLSQSEGSGLSFSTSWLGRGWPQETESKTKIGDRSSQIFTSWKNLCEKCFIWPHGLYSSWNSPGKNTGMGSLSLLHGIFPTQGLKPGLPHCRWFLYQLSHQGSPRILEWVASLFSSGSSQPRKWIGVSCITGWFFTNWAIREALNIKRGTQVTLLNWFSTPWITKLLSTLHQLDCLGLDSSAL